MSMFFGSPFTPPQRGHPFACTTNGLRVIQRDLLLVKISIVTQNLSMRVARPGAVGSPHASERSQVATLAICHRSVMESRLVRPGAPVFHPAKAQPKGKS